MIRFSPSIEQRKQFIIAKLTIWVWCGVAIMNGQIVYMFTDCLHGKAAELCLANSGNNRVTTTKYLGTIIASTASVHGTHYSFYHVVLVKFYCDVITKSRLQLINTLIDTFFSKLHAFLT